MRAFRAHWSALNKDKEMGFATGGQCYASVVEAAEAACQAFPVSGVVDTDLTTWSCIGVQASPLQLQLQKQRAGDSGTYFMNQTVSFPSCEELARYSDMSALWLLLVCAAAIVWLTKRVFWRLLANQ